MRRALLALIMLGTLALPAGAGVTQSPVATMPGRQYPAELAFAEVPDLQNYCSTESNPIMLPALGVAQLRGMAADLIAFRPSFVLQVGDLTDNTGGADQNGTASDADDPDTYVTTPAQYAEWTCVKENFFDLLDAAGIPWLAASGNHDSYRDFERIFPRATFLLESYAYAAQNDVDRWHAGFSDTEQRAALFETPIGPICAVTGDYAMNPAGGTLDTTFVSANIGCGAGHPTIGVRHFDVISAAMGYGDVANAELFMGLYGHVTPTQPGIMQSVSIEDDGSGEALEVFSNSQEVSLACGGGATDGTSMHTGVTWWTLIRVIPSANKIVVQARNPHYGGAASDPACGNTYQNGESTFSPALCTRFPSLKGC